MSAEVPVTLSTDTWVAMTDTHFDNTDASFKIGEFVGNELPEFSPKLVRGSDMRGAEHGATIHRW